VRIRLAASLAVVALLAACGGDDPMSESEFADAVEDSGLDAETSECVAADVYDTLDEDQLEQLTPDALEGDDPPTEEIGDALTSALGSCMGGAPEDAEEEPAEEE
jgi:hypothetical protein